MEVNDIAVRPAKREVNLGDGTTYTYGSTGPTEANAAARRALISYFVPQHHHKPSGLESSWKSSYQTTPKLTRSMLLNPEQLHRVPEGSSCLKYGPLRILSQALQEEYAFLTIYYHLSRPQLIIPPPCRLTLVISSRRRQESNFSHY